MLRSEFLSSLGAELKKRNVPEAADIVGEYEQHFAFKLADGYSEEEIAAKLGSPAALAAQFESGAVGAKGGGKKLLTVIGLIFTDLFVGAFFILLFAWGLVMAVFSTACAVLAVCLLGQMNIHSLIPPLPYASAIIFGVASAALALTAAVGWLYFAAFIRQAMRSFGRFRHNALAAASGDAVLPGLPPYPQFSGKAKRRLRGAALLGLTVLAASFVLGNIISMISAGALDYWHAWGWFGYSGS